MPEIMFKHAKQPRGPTLLDRLKLRVACLPVDDDKERTDFITANEEERTLKTGTILRSNRLAPLPAIDLYI